MKFKVKSLRVEKKLTYNDRDDNYDDNLIYVLNCVEDRGHWEGNKYELTLWTRYGDCYSGWCPASYGIGYIKNVDSFAGMTHKPVSELCFELELNPMLESSKVTIDETDNDIFSLDCDGGDSYYPSGNASVNMSLFQECNRNKEKRPVWIFKGDSGAGKSYLSTIITNGNYEKSVYETDAHEVLDVIPNDIIVLGNKYPHTVEELEKHIIGEHETIIVDFKISK